MVNWKSYLPAAVLILLLTACGGDELGEGDPPIPGEGSDYVADPDTLGEDSPAYQMEPEADDLDREIVSSEDDAVVPVDEVVP